MAAELALIPGLLEALGLTAAGTAKPIKVEGPAADKAEKHLENAALIGLGITSKKPSIIAKGVKNTVDNIKDSVSNIKNKKDAKKDDSNSNNDKDPDNKDKAASAALATKEASDLKNKIGNPRERANFKGDPAYLEGKELEYAKKLQASRDQLSRGGKEIEISEDQIMGGPKKTSKISSKGAVDATRKHPVLSVDERKLASEQNSALTTARAKATEKNPIEQKSTDILNDRTRQDMTNTYPTEEDPINKIKGVKEEISPSFGKYFSVLGIPGMLGAISKVLPLSGADAQEVELSDIEDYLKELKKYADSDDPEDKKIFEEMLKEYEEETGHELLKDLEEGTEKEDSKKLSPKPELLDRI
jgi:hypothetical protein